MPLVRYINAFLLSALLATTMNHDSYADHAASADELNTGYSVLILFLEDEQYLTVIRRAKLILTFSGISDASEQLVDDIADTSEDALEQFDELADERPPLELKAFSDNMIGKITFDSLRSQTAREFIFDSDGFEKNLLLSQHKILRVISQLASQLSTFETSQKRIIWLQMISERYENFYQQVHKHIHIDEPEETT